MLQKELAKRLKSRYDTKMDGDGWLAVSSDGMPLCRVKYNGNCIVNDNPYLSEEYLGKIAEVQNELLTVKDYVALYEHAQQMKAADALAKYHGLFAGKEDEAPRRPPEVAQAIDDAIAALSGKKRKSRKEVKPHE